MKARAGRIEQQPRESFFLRRYMGGGIGGFYLDGKVFVQALDGLHADEPPEIE